ncbi:hypothetical protein Tco_1198919 [Tanacetum coccineum]
MEVDTPVWSLGRYGVSKALVGSNGKGNGGEGIWGSGDDSGVSGNGGGDGGVGAKAYSTMSASAVADIGV